MQRQFSLHASSMHCAESWDHPACSAHLGVVFFLWISLGFSLRPTFEVLGQEGKVPHHRLPIEIHSHRSFWVGNCTMQRSDFGPVVKVGQFFPDALVLGHNQQVNRCVRKGLVQRPGKRNVDIVGPGRIKLIENEDRMSSLRRLWIWHQCLDDSPSPRDRQKSRMLSSAWKTKK